MMNISHIASALIAVAAVAAVVSAASTSAQTSNISGAGSVIKHGLTAGCPGAPGCPPPLVDDKAAPKKSAGYVAKLVDINRASHAELAEIPSLGKSNADFLIMMRQKAPFRDGADLASRVCSQAPLNLEQTSIRVGAQEILYRGVDPKSPGWKCGPAPRTYSYGNNTYKI